MVERSAVNRLVGGSSPSPGAIFPLLALLFASVLLFGAAPAARANGPAADPAAEADLAAARALFERNLDAIRRRDRDAYLACYLQSERLARTGPTGFTARLRGPRRHDRAGEDWPDPFDAQDLRLVRVQPGVVYGTYRYRVRYGAAEAIGLSERVFVETPEGWKIAVSTAFAALPGVPPPPRALVGAHARRRHRRGRRSRTPSSSCATARSSAPARAPPARCRRGSTRPTSPATGSPPA